MHVVPREALAAAQEVELDDEEHSGDDAAEALDELDLRARGPPRRETVVEHDGPRSGGHGVLVHLEAVRAVLERVGRLHRLTGELARLPRGDEACAERIC